MVNFLGTETAPSSGVSSPTTIRKSVVLPASLGPTSPTFSQGFNWNEASTKSNCLPYCLLMFEKEIILKEQLAAPCLFQCSLTRKLRVALEGCVSLIKRIVSDRRGSSYVENPATAVASAGRDDFRRLSGSDGRT